MNLFASDPSPILCARYLDDKRVINQLRETAQLLCTALHLNGQVPSEVLGPNAMKPTHVHHPVTKWVASSKQSWQWTLEHFQALSEEKLVRWPNNPQHKSWVNLGPLFLAMPAPSSINSPHAQPVNCASRVGIADFRHIEDVFEAYRFYMSTRWDNDRTPPRWTNRGAPYWDKHYAE